MKKLIVASMALVFAGSAFATMDMQKEYKAKKADAKCADCHTTAMPKKGAADLNDFGKTCKAAMKDGKIDWTKVK